MGLALFSRILNKSGSDTHGFVISLNFLVIRGLFSSCSACWSKAIFSSGINRKKKQLKFESTAQARFLSINLGGFLFRRFVGDFLPSFEPLYATCQVVWLGPEIMAEGYKLTSVGSKADGNNGKFRFQTNDWMRLKNCLKISRVRIISFRGFSCHVYSQWKL